MTAFKKSLHSNGHFDFASVPLPFCFRFPSVMQVNLQSTSKDSKDLWNFLWKTQFAFGMPSNGTTFQRNYMLPFCFRFPSVLLPLC